MPLTQEEFDEAVKECCAHCASGNVPRFRPETSEWCHDFITERGASKTQAHLYCLATGLRKFYEANKNG